MTWLYFMSNILFFPSLTYRAVRLPSSAASAARYLAVRVNDDSLAGAQICAGDYAIVQVTAEVSGGDLAAVCTPAGKLLRYVYFEQDGRIRLEAANPAHPVHSYLAPQVQITGRVIKIERDLDARQDSCLGAG